jgi:hypothetical protein
LGLWQTNLFRDAAALALCKNAVLITGELARNGSSQRRVVNADEPPPPYAVAMLSVEDGRPIWCEPLPAAPFSWGLAVTRSGTAVVTCRDGRVIAFSSR